ncbi:hypothetical protein ACFOOM_00980 [Streptomyces echinoruber]|uniref:Uncharacterized protein n=1 Tax=Streptomyces echinoruber TaxID=68898 RepID=A0A918V640_9ACTN|nr:hypothetical protein [Streptomyces echinoruber]GGZ73192.1 hypothetical protein GCM10010389_08380 [Streptomyces echinoruber]
MATITPTALTATELADRLAEQIAPLRDLFHSGNANTATGSRVVHDSVKGLIKALRAGEIDPVVAQVRLIAINKRATFYNVRRITAGEIH